MPTEQFTNGYALLIAVNDNQIPNYALPAVARDVAALSRVLVDPERCAYPAANVRVLRGPQASRAGIFQGIAWLKNKIATDVSDDTTALIYYTGHGAYNREDGSYYLLPYDLTHPLPESLLRAVDLADEIETVRPRRMLVILDCCHAGGMGIKGEDLLAEAGLKKSAAPPKTRSVVALLQGQGRAVLSSSSASENSYVRADRSMSIFTHHLVEALSGRAQPENAKEVLVSDVMGYVSRAVPQSAWNEYEVSQTPVYELSGHNFPVGLYQGGRAAEKGQPADSAYPANEPANGRTVHTGGGAFISGGRIVGGDFSNGKTVKGDQVGGSKNELSGNFNQSVVNIGSRLSHVSQAILTAESCPTTTRAELNTLIASLQCELEQVPTDRSGDADQVVNRLRRLALELDGGDQELIELDSNAMLRAAYQLGDARPGIPAVARQIAAVIARSVIK